MSGVSGSENHLLALLPELPALGWQADVLIPTPRPADLRPYARRLAEEGGGRVWLLPTRMDVDPRLLARMRGVGSDYAVVHTHLVHADWHAAAACRGPAKLVSTKHNHDPFRLRLPVRVVERLAMRRFDAVIAISGSLADFITDSTGQRPQVVRYGLPAGAPPASPPPPDPVLLAVGRLEPQKGLDTLLRALPAVVERHPATRLRIAGTGSLEGPLRRLADELGIAEHVEFLGYREDVDSLLADSRMLVHPARWEGFGLVLLEAMRAARPIVASAAGAIPEVVEDGRSGILVPPGEPGALAAAVVRLLDHAGAATDAGKQGRTRLEHAFSPRRMAAETARVYERVVSR